MNIFANRGPTIEVTIPSLGVIFFKPKNFPQMLDDSYILSIPRDIGPLAAQFFREIAEHLDRANGK